MTQKGNPNVHFADGTPLEAADKVTYLGGTITKEAYPRDAIQTPLTMPHTCPPF